MYFIKKGFRISAKVILSFFGLILLLFLLLYLPPVQQKIKDVILQELMKKTNGIMQIGNLKFTPFNHIRLEDIFVSDLQGDTLFFAENMDAKFNLFGLFKKQLLIHSVEADDFNIRIAKDSINSPYNFEFLIDTFASDSTSSNGSAMQIEIDEVILKNGNLSYDIFSKPLSNNMLFDANHVKISHFNSIIHLQSLDLEKLKINVANLSFTEQCGFSLDNLHFNLKSEEKIISLYDFSTKLTDSELSIEEAILDYTGLKINNILAGANYSVKFSSDKIKAKDLVYFSQKLKTFTDTLTFSGELKGSFPAIGLHSFNVNYGKYFRLTADANLPDFNDWATSDVAVRIEKCRYMDYLYKNIYLKANYEKENLKIELKSEDENMPLTLYGNVLLNGENREATLHADLNGVRPDVLHWLPKLPESKISGIVNAQIKGFNPESMKVSATIDSLKLLTQNGVLEDSPIVITYDAASGKQKRFKIRSGIMNFGLNGKFSFDAVIQSLKQAFPALFSEKQTTKKKIQFYRENLDFFIAVRQANTIIRLLGIEKEIPDSALFVGKYNAIDSLVNFDARAFCFFNQSDTAKLHLNLSNIRDKMAVKFDANHKSALYSLSGDFDAEIHFIPKLKKAVSAVRIDLKNGSVSVNNTDFQMYPAQIDIRGKQYEIKDFSLQHSNSEYLKINGIVSENEEDSLLVSVNLLKIETILDALKNKIPLSGNVSGDIAFSRLLTAPRIVTRNFSIDSLLFDKYEIGNVSLRSGWSSTIQGFWFRAALNNTDTPESLVSGFIRPEKDSLSVTGNIQGIKLKWFADYLAGNIYGLEGEFGARFKAEGKISDPDFSGTAFLKKAKAGVRKLNTLYQVSDSAYIETNKIVFKDFTIYDENQHTGKINGSISHKRFSELNPKLTADFNNFLALNNARQTDSLFFGLLHINGRLQVTKQNKNWLIDGNLSNGKNNSILANIPEMPTEAQRYNWITFAGEENENENENFTETASCTNIQTVSIPAKKQKENPQNFSLPLKIHLTLSIDPNLNVGVLLNPSTNDVAQVTGRGNIDFTYDLNNAIMNMQGSYLIDGGKCSLSLKNITKKTFTIQNGSKLTFRDNPMNTVFDVTAIYSLKANPATLDPSFAELTTYSKIPVNCQLTASGNLNKIQLDYKVILPNEADEIQQKLNALLYSEELKIKEIAYLLTLGSFTPVNSDNQANTTSNANIWTSLASTSVTSQLNNLLSGVLKDNWTIGTDFHTKDNNFSEMDMDVNISTRLFNDRLTVNSTLGYHNNAIQTDNQMSNFTGDFDLEYKLSPGGNVLLRFFNLTNNQYYEKAKTTQGAGVIYKRQGKTFKQLFRSFRTKRNMNRKVSDENK
jgi:hypothetical protein